MPKNFIEIEARFLEINEDDLKKRLRDLGAEDLGEDIFTEIIGRRPNDPAGNNFMKIRKTKNVILLIYKNRRKHTIDGTEEVELKIDDFEKGREFMKRVGFSILRNQEKKRHTFILKGVAADIDTWPQVPTYVELEGDSENEIKNVAAMLGLDYAKDVFDSPGKILLERYKIPIHDLKLYTFNKIE